MKYSQGETLAETLGLVWVEHQRDLFNRLNPDLILPVPLHFWRRLRRGYNQAQSLAEMIARRLSRPCRPRWLRRIRDTPLQSMQSATARRQNVIGAFALSAWAQVKDSRVLLIDDVLTTGATADAVAGVLIHAGAAQVDVAVLAHR